MLRLLCIAALCAYVLCAPSSHHVQNHVSIDYMQGLFFEDLAHRYMVLVMKDGCYFWHLNHEEVAAGLTPSGVRHIESEFIAELDKGVTLTHLHRSNYNHMAGSIVVRCKNVDSYFIHRGYYDHIDLSSINLQGTLPPNITIIHASSSKGDGSKTSPIG